MADAILPCAVCNGAIPREGKKGRKFCSHACYHEAQRRGDVRVGRDPVHVYPCTGCGAQTNRRPSTDRSGQMCERVFCSRDCYDAHRALQRGPCQHCGAKVPVQGKKFCSQKCRVLAHRPLPRHCRNCKVLFSPLKFRSGGIVSDTHRMTCSAECRRAWIRRDPVRKRKISDAFQREKHPNWQGGSHNESFRGHDWKDVSERARDRAGRCCEHCGKTEKENGRRLDVNHIVPFHQHKRKAESNRLSNLEALCRRCHTIADWRWRKAHPVQSSLLFKS